MNIIETAVPFMENMKSQLGQYMEELNGKLKELGISQVSLQPSLEKIQKQIDSANNKFTIAFVGTFKTGKSTIINSLLQLEGKARLSSEFDPDTAKCIRLLKKERRQKYEAEVVFQDGTYPTEYLTWEEAVKYTSQVALNQSERHINEKAARIEEVRYYIDNPFLDLCNILDLPGTGTGEHADHDKVTDKKIMESDCIFWVVSTVEEPDRESVKNLQKVSTKMLPIINVWQYEQENISGMMTPEELKEKLSGQYQAYFAQAEEPVVYYAKEIDMAQQKGQPLREGWGKAAFTGKVREILQNIQKGDRMERIKGNLKNALGECDALFLQLLSSQELQGIRDGEEKERKETKALMDKLLKCKNMVSGDIKNEALKVTYDILEMFANASDAFISNRMNGINFQAVFHKERFRKELKKDFEQNYVKLKEGWLEEMVQEFSDDIKSVVMGAYSNFTLELEEENGAGKLWDKGFSISRFVESMADVMAKDMIARIVPTLIEMVTGGLLLLIPGGAILEAAITVVTAGITAIGSVGDDERLTAMQSSIKIQSRNEIRQQKALISGEFKKAGESFNGEYYRRISEEMAARKKATEEKLMKLTDVQDLLEGCHEEIGQLSNEVSGL